MLKHRFVRAALFLTLVLVYVPLMTAADHAGKDPSLVRLPYKGTTMMKALEARGIEIIALTKDGMDVVVDDKELDYLYSLGFPIAVIGTPDMPSAVNMLDPDMGLYTTYTELDTMLDSLETNYPTLAERSTIGSTLEGRDIYAIKISDNVSVDESEPEVLLMSALHCREIMTPEIAIKFATYLLENYGVIQEVTDMVNEREIWIIPMINADGHVYVQNNSGGPWWTWWRKNRRNNGDGTFGVDLNRNFGYLWGFDDIGSSPNTSSDVYRGPGPFSEPETQVIRDFCAGREFQLAFSYHSYGELLLYPWGYLPLYTPDHETFFKLGETMTANNGYFAGNVAMGAIYTVNGDSDDWAYGDEVGKPKMFMFTPEVNSSAQGGFGPDESWIQPTFDLLLDMNMKLLHYADNPYRILGPQSPTLAQQNFQLSWTGNEPADPNPVADYEVCEYKNLGFQAVDGADAASPWWAFDGFSVSGTRTFAGPGSYYSGQGNNLANTLTSASFLRVTDDADTVCAQLWYNIETDWDYAYFEVSTDGLIWQSVEGNVTTNSNPNGTNQGNGITGASPGWVKAIFPLTAYLGQDIHIRWHYSTDGAVVNEGIYIDEVGPVPNYDSKTTIASGITETTLDVTPGGYGSFSYQVRARDAEGDYSRWSNVADLDVDNATGVGDAAPKASRLGANRPNPFNPVTRIPYAVGADGSSTPVPVRLDVYNVAGQRVATLVNRSIAPGNYEAVWTGTNDTGSLVPSGVYFARLVVDGGSAMVRKMVLLK